MTAMKPKLTLNDLPSEKLPEFWNDSSRINALYAPFRDRSVNPRDWDSKQFFWKELIFTWCEHNNICTFSETDLKQCFIQNGRTPACLSIIITEMHKHGDIQTLDQFMVAPKKSWTGWAVDIAIRKPLSWSYNKVKNTLVSPITPSTIFVHTGVVKKQTEQLLFSVPDNSRNKLITIDELISVCNLKDVDLETLKLLLHSLTCQGTVDTLQKPEEVENLPKNTLLIKIAPRNIKLMPINDVDIGKFTLEQNENVLIRKIEELEKEKSVALANTKAYLVKGMRQMAKTCLKKQHEIERRIEKQVSVLENVQSLLGRIGNAESDGKVLESYKHALAALKTVFKDTGLSEDGVSDTMADLEGALDTHDDIQSQLSHSLNTTLDDELEQELAELLAEPSGPTPPDPPSPGAKSDEEDELTRRLNALKMPLVPNASPLNSPVKDSVPLA